LRSRLLLASTFVLTLLALAHPVWSADSLTLGAIPAQAIVMQGRTVTYMITVRSFSGLPIALGVTGLPAGATAAFNPPTLQPPTGGTASSTLTVTVSLRALVGIYPLNVTASDGSGTRWVTVELTVVFATGEFTVKASPTVLTMNRTAGSKTAVVTVVSIGSFNEVVTLSVTGLPQHVTASFTPPAVTPPFGGNASSALRIGVDSEIEGGTYPLTIVAVTGTVSRSTPLTLVIMGNTIAGIPTGSGLAFAVIAVGVGVAAAGVGVAVAVSGRSGSEIFAYGGYYYCRKHRIPLWYFNGRLWCPLEQRYLST